MCWQSRGSLRPLSEQSNLFLDVSNDFVSPCHCPVHVGIVAIVTILARHDVCVCLGASTDGTTQRLTLVGASGTLKGTGYDLTL